ncbi:Chromosome transmission fidelity protein 18 [Monoraphidium neglectum]|uniref:Chromosome transmission fidelity protein 18 n=1 Tax=Monoraphidium neglectum TaxID=145388 RepID=A0A0D2M8V6_9CHLO|nr:Chromosome transmission fidelity protein 18 [Monoraphidium neglectum]KIY91890.1 Chromosome transmission fidelity protein 18 [Monoraphidium neglectum]|eukprot:XP_013890910.1 Chromosome transmission fidelity protein 18 [Monoraphidium neglectum]
MSWGRSRTAAAAAWEAAVLAESARLAAEAAAQLQLDPTPAADGRGAAAAAAGGGGGGGPERRLWVDKYAPAGFTQLLSDEWVNREVAKWTRSWLPGFRPDPADEDDAGGGGGRGGGGAFGTGQKRKWGAGGGGGGRGRRRRAVTRQEAPVLLICGPPGAGKTTLAHVVAGHCGFRVVEINASDDRSAAALVRRVQDAAQMQPLLDAQRRPNCVVVDEIDGATGGSEGHGAVAALVKLVAGGGGGGGDKGGEAL